MGIVLIGTIGMTGIVSSKDGSSSSSASPVASEGSGAGSGEETPMDFKSIKKILKNDLLEEEAERKNEAILIKNREKQRKKVAAYNFPSTNDFWSFISELWLVKNAPNLNWDFEKADFGLEESIQGLFEDVGIFEITFKLLLISNPRPAHFSLPSNPSEYIFLLSLPFIRSMDLSKLEISLLLLEDYFRAKNGYFKEYVHEKELDQLLGRNFYERKFKIELVNKILSNYSYFIENKGFSFQQQFEVTKQMNDLLRSKPILLKAYENLLIKIDVLMKNNSEYKNYSKIYPSPEIQRKWLKNNDQNIGIFHNK